MSGAVVYVRVSTHDQVENHSLDTQERACREFCQRKGLAVARLFREEGESAKTANRPQLQEMLRFCIAHRKSHDLRSVVVYRVDRFARSVADHVAIRQQLRKLDIQLEAVQESFDETPSGRFMEHVMAAVAQFDNDTRAHPDLGGHEGGAPEGPMGMETTSRLPKAAALPIRAEP